MSLLLQIKQRRKQLPVGEVARGAKQNELDRTGIGVHQEVGLGMGLAHRRIPVRVERTGAVGALERVRAEEVALRLRQVGGQALRAHPVEIRERCRERRDGYPCACRCRDERPERISLRAKETRDFGSEK